MSTFLRLTSAVVLVVGVELITLGAACATGKLDSSVDLQPVNLLTEVPVLSSEVSQYTPPQRVQKGKAPKTSRAGTRFK
jgi:hypothetical protein